MNTLKKLKKLVLTARLKTGQHKVIFTKRDGSTRVMLATLRKVPATSGRSNVHGSPDHVVVYDKEDLGWKTIRIESIKEVKRA